MYKYCVFIILFLIHINIFSQNIIDTTFIIHSYQDTIDINNSEILYIKLLIDTNKLINNQILDIENQKIYINIDTSIHLPFTYRCRLRYIKKKISTTLLSIIYKDTLQSEELSPFHVIVPEIHPEERGEIYTNGYISRSIMMSSRGQSSVQSALDLQFYGEIAPFQIEGNLNDKNLPVQPEGTSARLQEIDRVYITLKKDNFKFTLGDFNIHSPENAVLSKYSRKLQGTSFSNISKTEKHSFNYGGVVAINKGKFSRIELKPIDGVSGPYKLQTIEANYIQVIAGSEKVYLDGILLKRGYDADYVIDYNTAEITFMPKIFIRTSMHIVIEFLYTDYNYAQASYGLYTEISGDKWQWGINYFSEGDIKAQPLLLSLSDSDKVVLAEAGANVPVKIPSFRATNYKDQNITYAIIDTLDYDSVFVYSRDSTTQLYKVDFTYVGKNKGNYIVSNYAINGKIYEWIAPINGIPQGEYEPIRILNAPKRINLIESYFFYKPSENLETRITIGYSQNDINTFSEQDNKSQGLAYKFELIGKPSSEHTLTFFSQGVQSQFTSLEPLYNPEENKIFNRELYTSEKMELWNGLIYNFKNEKNNFAHIKTSFFNKSKNEYSIIANANARYYWQKFHFVTTNDYSHTHLPSYQIDYLKHSSNIGFNIKTLWLGIDNKIEYHPIYKNKIMLNNSQEYYSFSPYIGWGDSTQTFLKLYYEYYNEKMPLIRKQHKTGYQLEIKKIIWSLRQNNYFVMQTSDTVKKNYFTSDNEVNLYTKNKSFNMQLRYILSQRQSPRIDYTYIEVPIGQGSHYWIDANNNGLQELDEFHIANFNDQAQYILLTIPTQDYISSYHQTCSFNFRFSPQLIKKFPVFLKNFSLQSFFDINQNTINFNFLGINKKPDSLINSSERFRSILEYHPQKINLSVRYEFYKQKILQTLIVGNIEQKKLNHSLQFYIPIAKKWNLQSISEYTYQSNKSVFRSSTSYSFAGYTEKLELQYLETKYQIRVGPRYSYVFDKEQNIKNNKIELYIEPRIFSIKAETFMGKFGWIYNIAKNLSDPTMEYLMLEGYKQGNNGLIQIQWQRTLNKLIQISLQYEGRIMQHSSMTHVGSITVRALL